MRILDSILPNKKLLFDDFDSQWFNNYDIAGLVCDQKLNDGIFFVSSKKLHVIPKGSLCYINFKLMKLFYTSNKSDNWTRSTIKFSSYLDLGSWMIQAVSGINPVEVRIGYAEKENPGFYHMYESLNLKDKIMVRDRSFVNSKMIEQLLYGSDLFVLYGVITNNIEVIINGVLEHKINDVKSKLDSIQRLTGSETELNEHVLSFKGELFIMQDNFSRACMSDYARLVNADQVMSI